MIQKIFNIFINSEQCDRKFVTNNLRIILPPTKWRVVIIIICKPQDLFQMFCTRALNLVISQFIFVFKSITFKITTLLSLEWRPYAYVTRCLCLLWSKRTLLTKLCLVRLSTIPLGFWQWTKLVDRKATFPSVTEVRVAKFAQRWTVTAPN